MTNGRLRMVGIRALARVGARFLSIITIVLVLGLTPAAASAATPPVAVSAGSSASASVVRTGLDDFVFDSYEAEFFLDRDADGRSTLRTVETFVAIFPADQNRGMRRAIPNYYKGVPVDVHNISVTDETGTARPFDVENDDEFTLVTSAATSFVEGPNTYVFSYEQSNVTAFAPDTNADEFYWDTNGTGWNQPFGSVEATIHLGEGLSDALVAEPDCYWGIARSTQQCEIAARDADTYVATHELLQRGQNVTVAFGFEPGTFVERDSSYLASPAGYGQSVGFLAALSALIWAIRLRRTQLADAAGRPTIIAEYAPPKGVSVATAALVINKRTRVVAAQILDFAVRGTVRVLEQESKGMFRTRTEYRLELVDPTRVEGYELEILRALFGNSLHHGAIRELKTADSKLSRALYKIVQKQHSGLISAGYRRKVPANRYLPLLVAALAALASIVFGAVLITGSYGSAFPFVAIVFTMGVAFACVFLLFRSPLTPEGAELRDHLAGLELYIRLAEADRLRMLQSPAGALREHNEDTGAADVLAVYEKLLPYAVIFGLEKQWLTELGNYYADESPGWYSGSGAFNAAVFASSISTVSSSIANSYSGSSSSSSSGGSGGGGFSGGGGGGGGGGGV
ncbi:DUF2207 domain-containing protein [Salinibacterium sp. SWN167]|uniref:DUF2207 domain-containing protein n=1 Tax=Salinibacterium sp. SWN167 TaxID=2792054 RepID=UPI001E3C08C7|nr:DUF2207 domain-containing protein [Salinibacterium sp. SWN167]